MVSRLSQNNIAAEELILWFRLLFIGPDLKQKKCLENFRKLKSAFAVCQEWSQTNDPLINIWFAVLTLISTEEHNQTDG